LSHLAGVRIPSTLVEVLQARLDGLSPDERVLLQRASVLGRVFWDGALSFMEKGQEDQVQISPHMVEVLRNLSVKEMVSQIKFRLLKIRGILFYSYSIAGCHL
jgi:hypothetical protein